MAEGPLVHYYVRQLRKILEGQKIQIEFSLRKLKESEPPLEGLRIKTIEAHGKQFRFHFSDGRLLLIHLMMWGSWRIYRRGEIWDKPRNRARVIFRTKTHEAVVFSAPVVRLLTLDELQEDPKWGNLGPDPLRRDFSSKEFLRRLEQQGARAIGEVLLDQQVIAGVGNILRIEILFGARVHPHRPVSSLSVEERTGILRWTLRLFEKWTREVRGEKTWIRIYRKSGKPCPVCGTSIDFFRQAGRVTYACPSCQK